MKKAEHLLRGNGTIYGRAGNWLGLLLILTAFAPPS